MKLVRYGQPGSEKPGIVDENGQIRDASSLVPDITGAMLAAGGLGRLAGVDPSALPLAPEGQRLGACIGFVRNFIAIGLNYADHAAETGAPIPAEPIVFNKAPSCIVGPNDDVIIPRGSQKTDWEVELAIVIGERASYVGANEAFNYVAGYCVCNDVSEREFQIERGGQWTKGKSCDTFAPIGPYIATRDEIPDPQNLYIRCILNDEVVQDGTTSKMIFSVAELVSFLSHGMTLVPGDVILTGTPAGVGFVRDPKLFMKPGDEVSVEIEGLGTLTNPVEAA